MDLDSVNISKAINANSLDEKLNGLKWITPQYPDNPSVEIENLKKILNILEKDNTKKIIVTDYQFISVILSQYDNSPNKVWYSFHVYPSKNDKYFKTYKNFFIKKIKERNIETVYTIKPLYGDDDVLKNILSKDCIKKITINKNLIKQNLLKCKELM